MAVAECSRTTFADNEILGALSESDLAALAPSLRAVTPKKDDVILRSSRRIDAVYFPTSGMFSVTRTMSDGRLVETGTIGKEGVVGYLAAFGQVDSPTDVIVQIPPACAFVMGVESFTQALHRHYTLRAAVFRHLRRDHAFLGISVACNALHDVEARCARWLLHAHDRVESDQFQLSQEYLAAMLGVRRPSVTIAAGELRLRGLIRYTRGTIEIVDRAGLEAAACECYALASE